jgi:Zn-dependent protease
MTGSHWKIVDVAGFEIRVDPSWLVLAVLVVWSLASGWFPEVLPELGRWGLLAVSVLAAAGLFASLVAHELAHSVVARRLGLGVGGITLFLFGGVAELESEPRDPGSELRIALAGPAMSLALAAVLGPLATLPLPDVASAVIGYLAVANLVLGLFNLLPAFPLDGGRALRAVLWRRSGDLVAATRRAGRPAAVIAAGLMGLGALALFSGDLVGGLWAMLIGLFLFGARSATTRQLELRAALGGRTVATIMTPDPVVAGPEVTIAQLVDQIMLDRGVSFVPIVESGRLLGYVDAAMVRGIERGNWGGVRAGDILEPVDGAEIAPEMQTQALLERVTGTGRHKYVVTRDGALLGVVTLSDLMAQMRVASQVGRPALRRDAAA